MQAVAACRPRLRARHPATASAGWMPAATQPVAGVCSGPHRREQHDLAHVRRVPVRIITSRSIPRPTPAVGGMPCSSASTKASSNGWASSSPRRSSSACCSKRRALLVGIVELGEGVPDLDPADEGLPALDQALARSGGASRTARARPGSRARTWAGSARARRASRGRRRPASPSPRSGRARSPMAPASSSRLGRSARSSPVRSRIASRRVTRRHGGARSISTPSRSIFVVPSTCSATCETSCSSRSAASL